MARGRFVGALAWDRVGSPKLTAMEINNKIKTSSSLG